MLRFGEAERNYSCPLCNGPLSRCENCIGCGSCSVQFPQVSFEIPDFSLNRECYYGNFDQSIMHSLLKRMDVVNWRSAIKEISSDLAARKHRSLLDELQEARAGWKYLLGVSKNRRVLDYGGGLGGISVSLARSFGEVVCLDLTTESLAFGKRRAEQLGFTNITFVKGGDTPFWPFPDNCFDVVILNGVLECLPESCQKPPKLAQLDALREANRVLSCDGQIYIGIENRFSYKYFCGQREDRTDLLWGAPRPRRLPNFDRLALRRKPYRTYTHSLWGYKRLLRRAGFISCRFFVPYPSYRRFSRIVAVAHDQAMNERLKVGSGGDSPSSMFFTQRLLKYLAPSFFVIGSKKRNSASFLNQIVDHVIGQLAESNSRYGNARIRDILVSSGKIMALIDTSAGGYGHSEKMGFVIKIPLTPYGEERLERNINALEGIWNHVPMLSSMLPYVPRGLLKESFAGQRYFVEELMPGVCAESLPLSTPERARLIRSARDILTQLHTATVKRTTIDEAILETLFIKPIFEVADFLEYERESRSLNRITSMLRNTLLGEGLPLVLSHGDFSLKNVTVVETPLQITGLIDWDLSRRANLPLLDLMHLIAREQIVEKRYTLHDALRKCLFPLALRRISNDLVSNYIETMSIDYSVIPALCIMYWISRIHGHIGSLNALDVDWVNKNFVEVAEEISEYLC